MKRIYIFFGSLMIALMLVLVGVGGVGAVVHAQTYSSVLGTNGITYVYNAGTGTYMSNNVTYNPTTQMYTMGGVTYSYNQKTELYSSGGINYTYNFSTRTFVPTSATSAVTTVNSTPVFYTQLGSPVYAIPGQAIPAGRYFMANGSPLYYYGDGVYYNPTSQTYGDIYYPSFISTTYPGSFVVVNTPAKTPTAPNTGAGGEAPLNWALLMLSALIVVVGTTYLVRQASEAIVNKS